MWLTGRARLCALTAVIACAAAPAAEAADADWVQRALGSQYELGSEIGFANAPWIGTHNSFNSTAEMGQTLSAQDANQQIDLVSQLDAGMRSLELDVHRYPDIGGVPRVCHARGHDQLHFGCTIEKELTIVLGEVAAWLNEAGHEEEVLLLYLEDHLDDDEGYGDGAAAVTAQLGDLVFTPPPGACSEVPQDLTRNDVLAAGHQVVIVSDCGVGTAWPGVAFNWDSHVEDRPVDYADFPDCGPDFDRATYDTLFVRYYEDSTALTNQVGPPTGIATPDDGITPETAAAMMRCGVDLIGLDQLGGPADPRLEALVWSWAPGEPGPGGQAGGRPRRCIKQVVSAALPFGRWRDTRCEIKRATACRMADGSWTVLKRRRHERRAILACGRRGGAIGAPRTGFEAQQLRLAMAAAGVRAARLGLRLADDDSFRPLDS